MSKQGVEAPAKMNKNEQRVVMGVEQSGIKNGLLFWMVLILRKYCTCCEKNLE